MSYTSTVSASLRQFLPCFRQKTFTDGPTSARWSKLLSWGAAGVLEYRQYFGNIYSAGTRSISGFCSADTLYSKRPSISGFDTADTPVLAVLLLLEQQEYCEYRSIRSIEPRNTWALGVKSIRRTKPRNTASTRRVYIPEILPVLKYSSCSPRK